MLVANAVTLQTLKMGGNASTPSLSITAPLTVTNLELQSGSVYVKYIQSKKPYLKIEALLLQPKVLVFRLHPAKKSQFT